MLVRQGVLFLTAGSDLAGHRNVGKNKRTKYYEAYKPYFKVRFRCEQSAQTRSILRRTFTWRKQLSKNVNFYATNEADKAYCK